MDLSGKNVVYIGGFGGIGQRCVVEFLSKNIKNLAIFDLNQNADLLQEWQKKYSATNIFFVPLDITKKEQIEAAYKTAIDKMAHIDVVVNGSGLMNDRHVELTIQINLLGLIQSTLTAISYMDKSKGGKGGVILNISSVAGLEPTAMLAVYCAAKTGVTAFTRSLANPVYHAATGISFVTVCPGLTDTTLLDTMEDKTTLDYENQAFARRFDVVKRQSPEVCASNIVKAVEIAKNGAVWLLDVGEMTELEFKVLWTPQAKA